MNQITRVKEKDGEKSRIVLDDATIRAINAVQDARFAAAGTTPTSGEVIREAVRGWFTCSWNEANNT